MFLLSIKAKEPFNSASYRKGERRVDEKDDKKGHRGRGYNQKGDVTPSYFSVSISPQRSNFSYKVVGNLSAEAEA